MEIITRQKNKLIVKQVHVFSGYIFLRFDTRLITWVKINSTYGVSKILTFNNKPSEISSDIILGLKTRYKINCNSKKFQKGDTIKINEGPFSDLIGRIENVSANDRIWILLAAVKGYKKIYLHRSQNINIVNAKNLT